MAEEEEVWPKSAVQLMGDLMTQSAQDNYAVMNSLMDSYKRGRNEARAELALIREAIEDMFSGPFLPNSDYVLKALYPTRRQIDERMKSDAA